MEVRTYFFYPVASAALALLKQEHSMSRPLDSHTVDYHLQVSTKQFASYALYEFHSVAETARVHRGREVLLTFLSLLVNHHCCKARCSPLTSEVVVRVD